MLLWARRNKIKCTYWVPRMNKIKCSHWSKKGPKSSVPVGHCWTVGNDERSKKVEKYKLKFEILAIVSIIIFCFAIAPVGLQNDTFYTIKIGEYILENGVAVGQDPFSWHENLTYAFPHWAYDVFMFLVYDLGGMTGIYLSTCILTAILGVLLYIVHSKLNKNALLAFFMSILSIYLLADFIAARAQLVTFIIFLLEVFFIEMFLNTKKKRYAIGLIILPIIIANVHSAVWPFYFVLMLPYIADYIFNAFIINIDIYYYKLRIKLLNNKIKKASNDVDLIAKLNTKLIKIYAKMSRELENKGKDGYITDKIVFEKNSNGKWLILIAIICGFTCFLTPIGDMPYTYLIRIFEGTTTKSINEHLPMTLANNINFSVLLGITIALAIFAKIKLRLKDWFMLVGLFILAIISRRQESMVALIALIPISNMIVQIFNRYDKEGTKEVMQLMTKFLGIILTLALIGLMAFAMMKSKYKQDYISTSDYPVAASDFILENLDLDRMKLFNEYNYGAYLLFRGIPVFIDSRCDLYTPEFNEGVNMFNDCLNVYGLGVGYENKFEQYGVTHVIITKNGKLNLLLEKDDNYNCIYTDENFKIYERLNSGYSVIK